MHLFNSIGKFRLNFVIDQTLNQFVEQSHFLNASTKFIVASPIKSNPVYIFQWAFPHRFPAAHPRFRSFQTNSAETFIMIIF